jgi:hypothetical protein
MLNFAHKIDNAPFYQQADMVNQKNLGSIAHSQIITVIDPGQTLRYDYAKNFKYYITTLKLLENR